jgi:hypothetical protein
MTRILYLLLLLFFVVLCLGQVKRSPKKVVHIPKPDLSDTTWVYSLGMNENNDGYFLYVNTAMHTGNIIADGELTDYSPSQLFFGYDTSIVIIKGSHLIPK